MRHVGKEKRLCPACFLCSHKLRFQTFVFLNSVQCTLHQQKHYQDKDAPAEENRRNDQIRVTEQSHCQISCQEEDKQNDRELQNLPFLLPVALCADVPGKTNILHNIVRH